MHAHVAGTWHPYPYRALSTFSLHPLPRRPQAPPARGSRRRQALALRSWAMQPSSSCMEARRKLDLIPMTAREALAACIQTSGPCHQAAVRRPRPGTGAAAWAQTPMRSSRCSPKQAWQRRTSGQQCRCSSSSSSSRLPTSSSMQRGLVTLQPRQRSQPAVALVGQSCQTRRPCLLSSCCLRGCACYARGGQRCGRGRTWGLRMRCCRCGTVGGEHAVWEEDCIVGCI